MRFAILAVGLLASGLGGCAKDTLVHGPFVIGPEQPYRYTGACCVPGRIYSQNARQDWVACQNGGVACSRAEELSVTVETTTRPVEDLKGPPRRTERPRSAWD